MKRTYKLLIKTCIKKYLGILSNVFRFIIKLKFQLNYRQIMKNTNAIEDMHIQI